MSLVTSTVWDGHGIECGGFLWFVVRRRKLGGNAEWRGGHAFHLMRTVYGLGKTCFEDANGK